MAVVDLPPSGSHHLRVASPDVGVSESIAPHDVGLRYAAASDGLQGELNQVIIGLPPIAPDSPAAQLTAAEGVRYLVDVALCIVAVLLAAELVATFAIRHVREVGGDITGVEDILLRANGPAQQGAYIALLGDSVVKDSALRRAIGRGAKHSTIAAYAAEDARRQLPTASIVDLGLDGALVNDFAGILSLLFSESAPPSAVIVQLDYRVLSPIHDEEQNLSRQWLAPYVPVVTPSASIGYTTPELLSRPIDERVHRALLRSRAYVMLRSGRRSLEASILDRLDAGRQPPDDTPTDLQALKLLVAPFYRTDRSLERSRVLPDLLRAIDAAVARGIPVLLCFTPANFDFLGDGANVPNYRANVGAAEAAIRATFGATGLVRWLSLEGEVPTRMFLDHCHLTADGNRLVAARAIDNLSMLLADAHR